MTNKYCHAELDSASTLDIVHRFRIEFGMTIRNELFGHPPAFIYTGRKKRSVRTAEHCMYLLSAGLLFHGN